MENENIGFDDFLTAFDEDSSYQTEVTEEAEEAESTETAEDSGEDVQEEAEDGAAEDAADPEETPGKQEEKPAEPEQTFTIKVNKEERTVGVAEMTELAQKGADYDRVKGQLAESRQLNQSMQERLGKYQGVMDVLEMISSQTNVSLEELAEQVHMNFLMKDGKSEAEAKLEIRAAKAEKQLDAMKNQQVQKQTAQSSPQNRVRQEIAEFQQQYPDVELNKELVEKLMGDVKAGMSLTKAYQKMEDARKDAEIAELQRKLAAAEQNKKNRANSPGSQSDSGGRRAKTDFDDFMSAFN